MTIRIILSIIQILMCIVLIGVVLMQSGKSSGLSGSIAGGAETFFGKNKGRTIDALLNKWTTVVALIFAGSSILLFYFSNFR